MASLPLRASAAEASAWSQANENNEVVGHHRGPDIGLEVVEPAPGAAGQAVGPLEAGDRYAINCTAKSKLDRQGMRQGRSL